MSVEADIETIEVESRLMRARMVRVCRENDELLSALESLIDMDVSYMRGKLVIEAVEKAKAVIAKVKASNA
jgi:hypothetical protein